MIRLEHIHLQFADRTLLEDECLCLREGRVHVLMGRSGSGKTTLLNEIALNGSGQSLVYEWNGIEVSALREEKKAQLRRAQIGYVMQDLEVIDSRLTLEENLPSIWHPCLATVCRLSVKDACSFIKVAAWMVLWKRS